MFYRCGADTGFCGENSVCDVAKSENVTKVFKTIDIHKDEAYEELRILNHTLCKCVSID